MCGICGVIGSEPSEWLDRMLPALRHRGPDDEGRYLSQGVGIGARRLQVIDPQGGHQPLSNETGTVWVALNGEIYNYRELREELMRNGHRFSSHCDTEVLAHLYEEEGTEGIKQLRGMFAFALWDREREMLLLARDRMGIKPLYYAMGEGQVGARFHLAFSSELPPLAHVLDRSEPEPEALLEYLTWLYVPSPRTLYRGIQHLPPGHLLQYRRGQMEIIRYAAIDEPAGRSTWSSMAEARELAKTAAGAVACSAVLRASVSARPGSLRLSPLFSVRSFPPGSTSRTSPLDIESARPAPFGSQAKSNSVPTTRTSYGPAMKR